MGWFEQGIFDQQWRNNLLEIGYGGRPREKKREERKIKDSVEKELGLG